MTAPDKPPSRPWFAVKSHGYGSGLPISWQGWLSLVGFVAASFVLALVLDPRAAVVVIGLLTVGLLILSQRKSDGPWRWRWGDRD